MYILDTRAKRQAGESISTQPTFAPAKTDDIDKLSSKQSDTTSKSK